MEQVKFKIETLKTVAKLIVRGCWLYSLDLVDAYYSIPVHEDLRKYLRFEFDGKLYQYIHTCLMDIEMRPKYSLDFWQSHCIR